MVKTYLSLNDEMILLCILRLKDKAYLVSIREILLKTTKKKWTIGNIFVFLEKLEKLNYIESHLGSSTTKRGGRAIKFYSVTQTGIMALKTVRSVQDELWDGLFDYVFSKPEI